MADITSAASMSATTTAALTSAGILALFPNLDASVVLGAFSGASVFVLSRQDFSAFKRLAFLVLAFFNGILSASMSATILQNFMPDKVIVPIGLGALLSAALSINILLFLIEQDVSALFSRMPTKGGK